MSDRQLWARPFACKKCGQDFYRKNILKTHEERCLREDVSATETVRTGAQSTFAVPTTEGDQHGDKALEFVQNLKKEPPLHSKFNLVEELAGQHDRNLANLENTQRCPSVEA